MAIWAWVMAIAVVAAIALIALAARQRQMAAPRQRHGPEYDRTPAARDDRRAAEADLRDRERERARLDIRPLPEDSVDHPEVAENYRFTHGVHERERAQQASTEDLRDALLRYRSLFSELPTGPDGYEGMPTTGRAMPAQESEVPDE